MIQEYDNKDIGDAIDKAFKAGQEDIARKTIQWLTDNFSSFKTVECLGHTFTCDIGKVIEGYKTSVNIWLEDNQNE